MNSDSGEKTKTGPKRFYSSEFPLILRERAGGQNKPATAAGEKQQNLQLTPAFTLNIVALTGTIEKVSRHVRPGPLLKAKPHDSRISHTAVDMQWWEREI